MLSILPSINLFLTAWQDAKQLERLCQWQHMNLHEPREHCCPLWLKVFKSVSPSDHTQRHWQVWSQVCSAASLTTPSNEITMYWHTPRGHVLSSWELTKSSEEQFQWTLYFQLVFSCSLSEDKVLYTPRFWCPRNNWSQFYFASHL